jgi:glucose/arabinose dehydrogenase
MGTVRPNICSKIRQVRFGRLVAASVSICALSYLGLSAADAAGTGTAAVAAKGFVVKVAVASGLGAPRGILQLADGALIITDMGGWTKSKGRILKLASPMASPVVLFTGIDRPHGVVLGPDGQVYVGETGRVFRFDPSSKTPTRTYVIGAKGATGVAAALPLRKKDHLHPLTQLLFLTDGSLIVNFGSSTNNCAGDSKKGTCADASGPRSVAVVRQYTFDKPGGKVVGWKVMASGLRNSMGFAQHTSGTVLQIENARDAINEADPKLSDDLLPHDEINELVSGANYGWPYCYDNQVNSPEFKSYACKSTTAPVTLLPAHCAPLGLTYWNNQLVITYHGYRDTGHRLVAFPIDAKGRPNGASTEILSGWAETDDYAPGGPVGVIGAKDGSLLVVDDRNGTLLQITKS